MNKDDKLSFLNMIFVVSISIFAVAASFITIFSRVGVSDPMSPVAIMDFSPIEFSLDHGWVQMKS